MMVGYALTIFLSAFLLFQVQPLLGKHILPWFGGGAGVWTACLLFYQVLLLVGYGYAHLVSGRMSLRWQGLLHLFLLALSLLFLPITPGSDWKPADADRPTLRILILLLVHIGAPYMLLSSTGPLLQRWWSRTIDRSPYRLYALSNAGSLLALITYPFVVETQLKLRIQSTTWSWAYGVFVLICGWCAWRMVRAGNGARMPVDLKQKMEGVEPQPGEYQRPSANILVWWLILAATGSVMLLATTNQLCQDLAVVPLLWVLPLAVYLLTFVICFGHERAYTRWFYGPLLTISAFAAAYLLYQDRSSYIWLQIAIYTLALFASCMVCHGELVRLKPAAQYLTKFYLSVAAGGAIGGVLVAVIAPSIFDHFWEYRLALVAGCLWFILCSHRRHGTVSRFESVLVIRVMMWLGLSGLILGLGYEIVLERRLAIESSRNFYGVLRVVEDPPGVANRQRAMIHGHTVHGTQFLNSLRRKWPTRYFGRKSGVGLAIDQFPKGADGSNLKIGVVGLGVGTLSIYGRAGDHIRFYEINPQVERMARKHFSYLADSPANVEIVYGDARVVLEHEAERGELQQFDVLVIDAFNSDALPMHLLTREAAALYWQHLKPDGLLLMHITNFYVEVAPVVRGLAQETGCQILRFISPAQPRTLGTDVAEWTILTNNQSFLNDPFIRMAVTQWHAADAPPLVWTDDHASLWRIVGKKAPRRKWALSLLPGRWIVDEAELINRADRERIETLCQALYDETQGNPIFVVTIQSMVRRGLRGITFEEFASRMFRRATLATDQPASALMLIASRFDREVTIHLGPRWVDEQGTFQLILNETLTGQQSGDTSAALTACVERIVGRIRGGLMTNDE